MTVPVARRYDAYKASEAEWLGEVPNAWNVVRTKELFAERNQRSLAGEETLLTVSHITGVTPRSEKNVNMFMAETMEGYNVCHEGDLIINTMWAWMGALGTSPYDGICSPSYGVYAPRKGVPYCARYYDYLFRTPNAIIEMTRFSKGIVSSRLRLYSDKFFQIAVPLPDFVTQQAIADYLDAKTAQIDRRIDLLTQKAAKYRQLKQSLINAAVTHGLDRSMPMKDSGVEWIGEVPAHWQISRVKELGILSRGVDLSRESFREGPYPVYGSNGILGYHSEFTTKGPCVTVGRSGSVGEVNYVSSNFWAHNTALFLQNSFDNDIRFIFYLLRSLDLQSYSAGSAVGTLNRNIIHQLVIAIPPSSEQNAIAVYLDGKAVHIDRIIDSVKSEIEKLKELRKALINDVVTGKLRVT